MHLVEVAMVVADLPTSVPDLCSAFGFEATQGPIHNGHESCYLRRGGVSLHVMPANLTEDTRDFYDRHGDGVYSLVFRCEDLTAARKGLAADPSLSATSGTYNGENCLEVTNDWDGIKFVLVDSKQDSYGAGFHHDDSDLSEADWIGIDHFAILSLRDAFTPLVAFYRQTLGMKEIFTEEIVVGSERMDSVVVQTPDGSATFTVICPGPGVRGGQIQSFLLNHGGGGVQHIAFEVRDIVSSVRELNNRGLEFLSTPSEYYGRVTTRLSTVPPVLSELKELSILVDEDHHGQLFQIFTKSRHPRGTLFFELIEREGAKTFGSANIRDLYLAVKNGG